jgi:hypothetical protein
MKLVTGVALVWHVGEIPFDQVSVLAVTAGDITGEAFHTGESWHWASAGLIEEDVVAWAELPNAMKVAELIAIAVNPVSQAHVQDWISTMLANHMVVKAIEETVVKVARIRGISSIVVQGVTDSEIDAAMRQQLEAFALRQITAGLALPEFGKAVPEVNPEVAKVVVTSRLKALLKARAKEWAVNRTNLPPHIIPAFLADLDVLIGRHASTLQSAQ